MRKKLAYLSGLFVLALVISTVQEAGALNLASTSCTWSDVVGGNFVNFPAPAGQLCSVRWGTVDPQDPANQSGLDFLGGAPITPIPVATDFVLGTLTHLNRVIAGTTASGDAPSAATLNFSPVFSDPALAPLMSLLISVNETANDGPCPVGVPPCADIISFPGVFPSFAVDGVILSIVGFRDPVTLLITDQFISPEGGSNDAQLIARIDRIPNPSALLLIGLGLVGLVGISRIRSRQT